MRTRTPRMNRFLLAALVTGFVAVAAPAWGQVFNEDFKLSAEDATESDVFGSSVAIDNAVIAVGAYGGGDPGSRSGSAYLFDAATGKQIERLLPSDGAAEDRFGFSIGIDNGFVVVGSPLDDDNGRMSGSAYLFDASTGVQLAKLLPSDGAFEDRFGVSIAIDNGVVVVGAHRSGGVRTGAAYLFDAATGAQIAKLFPSDGRIWDHFGFCVAIDGGIVAVGAPGNDDIGYRSGSVYLFDASTGAPLFKLLPNDRSRGAEFGYSIAIDNGVVAIGAMLDDDNGGSSGSAYLFEASTGAQITKLLPLDGAEGARFGSSIALDNGVVAVGAWGNDDNEIGSDVGAAYLFDAFTGDQIAKLIPSDGAEDDLFGGSVAIDNGVVVVGALADDDNGSNSGSAYVFDVGVGGCMRDPAWICDGDVDGDGQVNPVDAGLVQAAFGSLDDQDLCNYDIDCDGQINPVDSSIVQSLFGTCEAPRNVCP